MNYARTIGAFLALAMMSPLVNWQGAGADVLQQSPCRAFPETGQTVCGKFLSYWQQHGGLAQQGYPISGGFVEVSDVNGRAYTVPYFERAVFELRPENRA